MKNAVAELNGFERSVAKQASRDADARRLASGAVSKKHLKQENSFFGALSMSKFKMVAIGGRSIAGNI